jgi:mannan endo-1,4-beta-mannosidase
VSSIPLNAIPRALNFASLAVRFKDFHSDILLVHFPRKEKLMHFFRALLLLLLSTPPLFAQSFVQRNATHLTVDGAPFRYSGPNIEWLGLEAYGPHDPAGPRYPSRFEIDDAFATAAEMGAKVVRAQTIGDTVGCPLCIEPELGRFNDDAFQAADYAVATAAKHHMRLIIPLIGDCATCSGGGLGQFLAWNHKQNFQDFFTDPAIVAAYERHIDAVLNHRNAINGVRYRDDPTIMAWENCNMCGIVSLFMGGGADALAQVAAWSETIGAHIKQVDHHHLYLDTTGIFRVFPKVLDNPSIDLVAFEEYPHWDKLLGPGAPPTTAATFSSDASLVTAHGKAFIVNEFGWDLTDWKTSQDLQQALDALARDPNISGDGFWALQAHLENFGFQPIPADCRDLAFAQQAECGEWWALYYPGIKTLVMSADDMAGRAQQLRAHAYAMSQTPLPKHAVPPAPVVTTVVFGLVAWRGSAGATRYSIDRFDAATKQWQTVCDKCATDADDPWIDPKPGSLGTQYRVTAFNADGVPSPTSPPH